MQSLQLQSLLTAHKYKESTEPADSGTQRTIPAAADGELDRQTRTDWSLHTVYFHELGSTDGRLLTIPFQDY